MESIRYSFGWNDRVVLTVTENSTIHLQSNNRNVVTTIECDLIHKTMQVTKQDIGEHIMEKSGDLDTERDFICDLNSLGDRWEGDLHNGLPYGYGHLYNGENMLIYTGFMYDGHPTCFGEEYCDSQLLYSGCFIHGTYYGFGKLYDMEGTIVYEGLWVNGGPSTSIISIPEKCENDDMIHNFITECRIGNDSYHNLRHFILNGFTKLSKLVIGDRCFDNVTHVEIYGCNKLTDLTIGFYNFKRSKYHLERYREKCKFLIYDCSSLKSIVFGNCQFADYMNVFELTSISRDSMK